MHPMYAEVHLVSENFQPCIVFAPYHTCVTIVFAPYTGQGGLEQNSGDMDGQGLGQYQLDNGWIIEYINLRQFLNICAN